MTCRGTRKWNLSSYEIVLLIHHSSSSSSRFARNPTNCPPTHLPFLKNPSYPNLYPLHPLDCSLSCLSALPYRRRRSNQFPRDLVKVEEKGETGASSSEGTVFAKGGSLSLSFRWIRAKSRRVGERGERKRERGGLIRRREGRTELRIRGKVGEEVDGRSGKKGFGAHS